ncbi:terpenoid cyclases/protein prenyltransferase alpha-alpha toroid [Polychytrium aggregatum]|uniref:terpenoid cyclases/protein prenyltransferase alpha-alpha toroid n=1 Tax=Polychytrium aggregatum TaxID=110093 RepID=UPI0022FED4DD|nr:terpenoid cyclases/protein prenyltransferase alpha-alpha toroid [Polychytrium aggregatum]KAI9209874.1 terpenoid cyclases/protein prenyltransferase alpha-alpha toroid [Polychytrium aggregatum]
MNTAIITPTVESQRATEESVLALLNSCADVSTVLLGRPLHASYLAKGLRGLSRGYITLDASKSWLVYWVVHSQALLGLKITPELAERVIDTLSRCQNETGGFGGGPGQMSHLASTYAAVNALVTIGTKEAYEVVNRSTLYRWMLSLKCSDGSFRMHTEGEIDVRGSYCAVACAKLLNLLTPELAENVGEFVAKCQSYEGGISSLPGLEAHGGYTFCGTAALEILNKSHLLDIERLMRWITFRQMDIEGGFSGRTNKLVDGCYSTWQGAVFPLLEVIHQRKHLSQDDKNKIVSLFSRERLQEYILICCQDESGGLRDKPEKGPDYYHTCYCLNGLSAAQHHYRWNTELNDFEVHETAVCVVGDRSNLLEPTHPVYGVLLENVAKAIDYFKDAPIPTMN